MKQFVLVGIVVTGCVQIMNGADGAGGAKAPENGALQRQPSQLRAARKASAVTVPLGRGAAGEAAKVVPGAHTAAQVPDSQKRLLPLLANLASAAPGRKGSQVNTNELAQQMAALSARAANAAAGAGAAHDENESSLVTEDAADEPVNGITADGSMSPEEAQLLVWYDQLDKICKGMPAVLKKADPKKTAWVVKLIHGSAMAIKRFTETNSEGEIDEERFDAADDE